MRKAAGLLDGLDAQASFDGELLYQVFAMILVVKRLFVAV